MQTKPVGAKDTTRYIIQGSVCRITHMKLQEECEDTYERSGLRGEQLEFSVAGHWKADMARAAETHSICQLTGHITALDPTLHRSALELLVLLDLV
ncbi:hypothetical protein NDU88_006114 [Pleurodeles waltl]|uniref:Uncharacterized protein n=1 Tax=Pleurodeles waltl TaxID=8319 RepID=A0AAV7SNL3_PLEWA|nr:hypothetical protein NDU88_006114 [Pleurodeles waltl]